MIVILANVSAAFAFSPELEKEVSFLLDLPDEIPEDLYEFAETAALYLRRMQEAVISGRPIMFLFSSPLACQMLQELREKPAKPNAADWQIITFFHDDASFLNADINIKPESRINIKVHELYKMLEYPFIKKISIPYGYEITHEYLKELVEKLAAK